LFGGHVGAEILETIQRIRNSLHELENYGYTVVFDENDLPPSQRGYRVQKLVYHNNEKEITFEIIWEPLGYDLYVNKNGENFWYCQRFDAGDIEKLKDKILSI
jgi:hypothetical protein